MASDTTALLFMAPPGAGKDGRPLQSLRQFGRAAGVAVGSEAELRLGLSAHDFALTDAAGDLAVAAGLWRIEVAGVVISVTVAVGTV